MRSKKKFKKSHSYRNCQIIKCSQLEECAYFGFQSQNVCTKSLLRIHFLQHYYRNASHRKDTTEERGRKLIAAQCCLSCC